MDKGDKRMFIVDFFKTISLARKAEKFVKQHEEDITKVKDLIAKVQEGIAFLENHKADVITKIEIIKTTLSKLKGLLGK